MFRWVKKKWHGDSKKALCPACGQHTFFRNNLSFAGLTYTDMFGPMGSIDCETCKRPIIVASDSMPQLTALAHPWKGFVPPELAAKMTQAEIDRILTIAL